MMFLLIFSLIFNVFLNIHEYANKVICIFGIICIFDHGIKGLCLIFNLVSSLVAYDK